MGQSPFFQYVPKDPEANLKWRIRCRERALVDEQFRNVLLQACEQDVLFFFGFALFVIEPRARVKRRVFTPWPHQEPVILAMDEAITEAMATGHPTSLTLQKSRAQGGTYTYLGVQIRRALINQDFSAGVVSRNEKAVDSKDPSSVFAKLASMLDDLPVWMLDGYERTVTDHTIRIPATNAIWVGFAATGDVARGSRFTMFAFDEVGSEEFISGGLDFRIMSSVAHITNCIFLCSTFGSDAGVFYESATDPDNPRVYSLDWKQNPEHTKLAFTKQDGVVKALRTEEQEAVEEYIRSHKRQLRSMERKGHKVDGRLLSPWYIAQCLVPGATPRFVARELDMDAKGASSKCFEPQLLDRMKKECCKAPVWEGVPVIDKENPELRGLLQREGGPLRLWFQPGIDFSPPIGPYTAGCDVASGGLSAHATPSVISMLNNTTGEQVLEYAIKGIEPRAFAHTVVALCMWMRKALLGWEDSANSGGFADEIAKLNYWNVFYRDTEMFGVQKKTRRVGWPIRRESDKADLFDNFAMAMDSGQYIPRSLEMVTECGEYEWDGDKLVHTPTKNKSRRNVNHADRCLVAGTMISTEKGEVPIEEVKIGNLVWTRNGLRPVIASGVTGIEEVFQVTLSNGKTLTGTGNHPIWTENRSWINLQSLKPGDRLLACKMNKKKFGAESTNVMPIQNQWSLMDESTIVGQIPSEIICGGIFGVDLSTETGLLLRYMLPFGCIITGLFQMAVSFITGTKTLLTTTFLILRQSPDLNMAKFTSVAGGFHGRPILKSTDMFVSIAAPNTGRFAGAERSFAAKNAVNCLLNCESVSSAKMSFKQRLGGIRERVLNYAQSVCERSGTAILASIAAPNTNLTESRKRSFAAKNAGGVLVADNVRQTGSPQVVYNLSVADTPEYFAQGILVHNCISAAGAWYVFSKENATDRLDKVDSGEESGQNPEYGSFLWRERQERRAVNSGSPRYGIRDLLGRL